MELRTTRQVQGTLELLRTIEHQDLDYETVSERQIISALLQEVGVEFAKGYLYKVLQGVANEARRRSLLINPDGVSQTSSAYGNVSAMLPSATGWEQTKGILMRHIADAEICLGELLFNRASAERNGSNFGWG